MSGASKMYEVGAVVLGYVGLTASWRRPGSEQSSLAAPLLVIQHSSSTGEGAHEPSQSITITSCDGLIALRKAIDEALKGFQQ
jgi:hypothetical protein